MLRFSVVVAVLAVTLLGAQAPTEPNDTRPLSAQSRANLIALARLAGVVRFFHPSDGAAATDWNAFLAAQVTAIEPAADSASLRDALQSAFATIAPTVRVHLAQAPTVLPAESEPSRATPRIVQWRHHGVALDPPRGHFTSLRIASDVPLGYGDLAQSIDARLARGRRVILRARVRVEPAGAGQAQLWLRVDRPGGERGFFDNMADRPVRSAAWTTVEIRGEVAPDAEQIVVGLVLSGGGRALLDDVELVTEQGAKLALANGGLDEGAAGYQPPGWTFPYESLRAGYRVRLVGGSECLHQSCAEIVADPLATPRFPPPAETQEIDLGAGLLAEVPVSLYADAAGTRPPSRPFQPPSGANAAGTGADRAHRLADVAAMWAVMEHFHPNVPPGLATAWARQLEQGLTDASTARDTHEQAIVLGRMLAALDDGNAGVIEPTRVPLRRLALDWEWIDRRLVVVASGEAAVHPGDIVTAIDGQAIEPLLAEIVARTSGASPEARRARALEELEYGPQGQRVRLALARATSNGGNAAESASAVEIDVVRTLTPFVAWPGAAPALRDLDQGIVYVDLRRFSDQELAAAAPRLAAARGVVFDLRGTTDCGTSLVSHIASRIVRSANLQMPVTLRPDHDGVAYVTTFWTLSPLSPRFPRSAFLLDERAQGFPETLLEIVEREHLAELVGVPSGGTNGNLNRLPLPSGLAVTFTGLRVARLDGSPYNGHPVQPTLLVARSLAGVRDGRDEVIAAAARLLTR